MVQKNKTLSLIIIHAAITLHWKCFWHKKFLRGSEVISRTQGLSMSCMYWKLWHPYSFLTFLLSQAMAVTLVCKIFWQCAQAGLSQCKAMVWFSSLQLKLSLICSSQKATVFLPEILHSKECVRVCVYVYVSMKAHMNLLSNHYFST